MLGAILVFIFVCAIVAIYMHVVRSFLRAAEKDDQPVAREWENVSKVAPVNERIPKRHVEAGSREQMAH